jgi:hypothetical protein
MPTGGVPPPRPTSANMSGTHGLMVSAASSHHLPTGNSNGAQTNGVPPHTPVSVGGVHLTAASQFNSSSGANSNDKTCAVLPSSTSPLPSSSANLVLVPNLTVTTTASPSSPRQTITPMSVGNSPAATLGQPSPANVTHISTPISPQLRASSSASNHHTIASAGGITLAPLSPAGNNGHNGVNGRGDMSPTQVNGLTGMNGHSISPVGWKGASLDSPLLGQHHINSSRICTWTCSIAIIINNINARINIIDQWSWYITS